MENRAPTNVVTVYRVEGCMREKGRGKGRQSKQEEEGKKDAIFKVWFVFHQYFQLGHKAFSSTSVEYMTHCSVNKRLYLLYRFLLLSLRLITHHDSVRLCEI